MSLNRAAATVALLLLLLLVACSLSGRQKTNGAVLRRPAARGADADRAAASAAALASLASLASTHRRQLMRRQQGTGTAASRQQCFWDERIGCFPNFFSPLAVDAAIKPTDAFQQFQLFAMDRAFFCSSITNAAACNKQQQRGCFWRDNAGSNTSFCWSADFNDEDWFTDGAGRTVQYMLDIPLGMSCPSSKIRAFLGCARVPSWAGDAACTAMKSCSLSGSGEDQRCWPDWAVDMPISQLESFVGSVLRLAPDNVGNCAGACWLRQAAACNTTGTTEAKCSQQGSYCEWSEADGTCKRTIGQPDRFNEALATLERQCWVLDVGGRAACEAKQMVLKQAGRWLDWTMPPGNATCNLTAAAAAADRDKAPARLAGAGISTKD